MDHYSPTNDAFTLSDEMTPSSAIVISPLYSAPQPNDQDSMRENGLRIEAIFPNRDVIAAGQCAVRSPRAQRLSGLAKETQLSRIACQRPRYDHALALCKDLLLLCTQGFELLHCTSQVFIGT